MSVKPLDVDGVDISHHQGGTLDLAGAKRRGLKWLYHKATEGDTMRDSNYPRRRAEAAKAGLPFGAYHFARADVGDARREARFFLDYATPKPGDLRPALDLETTEGMTLAEIRAWAAVFIRVVVKETGHKPIVYTPFELGVVDDGCLLWRPRYNNDNRPPLLPWDIWQFSDGVYGVPNRLAGFGNVDLNVMRKELTVRELLLPTPKPEPVHQTLKMAHASMQFSDTDAQMEADAVALFARAKEKGWAWFTGTEAGGQKAKPLPSLLRREARKNGYSFHIERSVWAAVSEDLATATPTSSWLPAIRASEGNHTHMERGVLAVEFPTAELGPVAVAVSHYLTQGRRPGDPNYALNTRLARVIGDWAVEAGAGKAIAFYHGDQNIVDRTDDTFRGEPLTSLWDELSKWRNTGHGNIDVIATYDADARVEAKAIRALDDDRFKLFTDHFLVEGAVTVRTLG